MRRLTAALLAPLAVTAALAGCSSSPSTATTSSNSSVTVSGAAGTAPTVKIPAKKASSNLVTKTLIKGTGTTLTAQDSYLAKFEVYDWTGKASKLLYSSYTASPQVFPVTMGTTLSGLQSALKGQQVGSRVLAVLPPKFGYGTAGNPQIGIKPTDTIVWVVDVLQAFPPTAAATGQHVTDGGGSLPLISAPATGAPTIKIPTSSPPSKLVSTTLIKGSGTQAKPGQTIVVRYVGTIWRTGQIFDQNSPSAASPSTPPAAFAIGKVPAQVIPAWNTDLVGVPIGSRVMLVVPPAEGYGAKGQSSAGIKGTDTLVFVVDVLAAA